MKSIILLAAVTIAFTLSSQAQFRVGIKGGLNRSEQRINVSGENSLFSNDHFQSYQAGIITEFKLSERFYLQPQLMYSRRGSKVLSSTGAADMKVRIDYADLPIHLVYKIPVGFGKLYGGAGPVFSYAFAGKQEQNGHTSGLFTGATNWKREDLSLGFTGGLEFNNGLFISINSQKGLYNIHKANGVSVKNRSTSFTIGYLIDWNKL